MSKSWEDKLKEA